MWSSSIGGEWVLFGGEAAVSCHDRSSLRRARGGRVRRRRDRSVRAGRTAGRRVAPVRREGGRISFRASWRRAVRAAGWRSRAAGRGAAGGPASAIPTQDCGARGRGFGRGRRFRHRRVGECQDRRGDVGQPGLRVHDGAGRDAARSRSDERDADALVVERVAGGPSCRARRTPRRGRTVTTTSVSSRTRERRSTSIRRPRWSSV